MITTEKKAEIIKEYQTKEGDTGSPERYHSLQSDKICLDGYKVSGRP